MFLLEAYVPLASTDADPIADILAAIAAEDDLRVLGTVVIPGDETALCVIEARSREAVHAALRRIGRDAIRVVEVRWQPG